jgi:chaperone modulatory protein CbpM
MACGVQAEWVISLVEESIIEPQGDEMHLWRFSGASLARLPFRTKTTMRLGR